MDARQENSNRNVAVPVQALWRKENLTVNVGLAGKKQKRGLQHKPNGAEIHITSKKGVQTLHV